MLIHIEDAELAAIYAPILADDEHKVTATDDDMNAGAVVYRDGDAVNAEVGDWGLSVPFDAERPDKGAYYLAGWLSGFDAGLNHQ